ncbi:hypothetical protein Mapa_003218 [Marchantia paleacea]|nr:hypothetical protein Mapa_003218 [Marchantia paleacea]
MFICSSCVVKLLCSKEHIAAQSENTSGEKDELSYPFVLMQASRPIIASACLLHAQTLSKHGTALRRQVCSARKPRYIQYDLLCVKNRIASSNGYRDD